MGARNVVRHTPESEGLGLGRGQAAVLSISGAGSVRKHETYWGHSDLVPLQGSDQFGLGITDGVLAPRNVQAA